MRPSVVLLASLLFVSVFAVAPVAESVSVPLVGSASASGIMGPDGG